MEWNDLEQVIADAAANIYSTEGENATMTSNFRTSTGYRNDPLGRKMKSTTDVNTTDSNDPNGSSKSAATGGFDALLVGYVYRGSRDYFGTVTGFWSSSSAGTFAWFRGLYYAEPGVGRPSNPRSFLFSVRCKKDN
jgi:hypothetical protein